MPIMWEFYTLVVPLEKNYNLFAIVNAFQFSVWVAAMVTIPIYISVMVMANWFNFRQMKWEIFASFVIRTALMENTLKPPAKRINQKLLIIFWALPIFVLVTAYTGNMTALITKPSPQKSIKDVNELVNQKKMSWVIEEGSSVVAYLKSAPAGTKFRINILVLS